MSQRRRKRQDSGAAGCLVIDKPTGCTSHDVVDSVRRALGTRKVGHAGTLDPDATGVLVLGVGPATKLLQFVTGVDKTYVGEVVFGTETSTLDAAGDVVATYDMSLELAAVQEAAQSFVGDILQVPPMVSAVKVDGKRLHELAREGKEIEREPRPVVVHRYDVAATEDPLVYTADVSCGSGTYVRSLAADLGTALGGGAHLRALRRTSVGPFTLDDATPLDAFEENPEAALAPVGSMLRHLPQLDVDETVATQVRHGRSLGPGGGQGQFAIVHNGHVLAVYEARDGEMRPVKVLAAS